jgi:Mg2+/Co2+ transporter CorB
LIFGEWATKHGLMLGGAVALAGLAMILTVVATWIGSGLGSLSQERIAISAATLLVLGIQIVFTSFLLSILGLRRE